MDNFPIRLITLTVFLPLAGALLLTLFRKTAEGAIKGFALLTSLVTFAVSVPLYFLYRPEAALWLKEPALDWIRSYGIRYAVGVDGISLFLVLLTTFITPVCLLASWNYIQKHVKEYYIAFLLLEMGMLGVFVALDVFLFYVFWELMLIPMYLIIGVWGGPRRIYAAVKFFIYTMIGSVLMLVAILYTYAAAGKHTFDYFAWLGVSIPGDVQVWLFLAFALAFAIKVPMFPFHTWLPDAHVEAPTAGSVILAAVLLKMGTYGFIRFAMPLYPQGASTFTPLICGLAVVGIIYGALVSMVQKDVKKLVAYSSVSHLGFVMLGMFAMTTMAVEGSILQMINHGISTGLLFLLVGVLYERRHTRLIEDFGGIGKVVPAFAVIFMITTLSSIGLPGTNGFVGEFLILLGSFQAQRTYTILAASGVILAAVYMLWMYQRVVFGVVTHPENEGMKDLSAREWAYLLPMVLFVFWIGFYPRTFLDKMEPSVNALVNGYHAGLVTSVAENAAPPTGDRIPAAGLAK